MVQSKMIEGTWEELSAHADELRAYKKLRLVIPDEEESQEQALPNDKEIEQFRKRGLRGVGLFAHMPGGSEEFARQKQEEIEREDRPRS